MHWCSELCYYLNMKKLAYGLIGGIFLTLVSIFFNILFYFPANLGLINIKSNTVGYLLIALFPDTSFLQNPNNPILILLVLLPFIIGFVFGILFYRKMSKIPKDFKNL